ncbi:MAG: hypothetical protein PVG49_10495 [Desulfobacteraceae bacterium]|jgi:hypothetical protein
MRTVRLLAILMISFFMMSAYAFALPTIEIRPSTVEVDTGDEIDFYIYLVGDATEDITMGLYAYSLWLDSSELDFVNFAYEDPAGWTEHINTSWTTPRNDDYTGYEDWWGSFDANHPSFQPYTITANSETLIGTLTAEVLTAVLDGAWDVVLEYYLPMDEGFYLGASWDKNLLTQAVGPDVVATPVPAAVLLLGSGLLGLIGIRRKAG